MCSNSFSGQKVDSTFHFLLSTFNFLLSTELILDATYRVSERSIVGVHEGIGAEEEEVARTGTAHCTTPVAADGTDIAERTIAEVAVARHGQFKGRCECTGSVIG